MNGQPLYNFLSDEFHFLKSYIKWGKTLNSLAMWVLVCVPSCLLVSEKKKMRRLSFNRFFVFVSIYSGLNGM